METLILPKKVAIPTDEIAYLQSDSNYTNVITRSRSRNHFVALTLCKIQASLTPENFVRVNRSYLINMSYVKRYERVRDTVCLTLKNNKRLLCSRRRTALVLNSLENYTNTTSR